MKVPGAQQEFVDYGFCPKLYPNLPGDYEKYVETVGMATYGVPAPNLEDRKSAVWIGSKPDGRGEVPAIAVLAGDIDWFNSDETLWFVGVAALELIDRRAEEIDSIEPRRAAILEVATHPVHAQQGSFTNSLTALNLLMRLHPRSYVSR